MPKPTVTFQVYDMTSSYRSWLGERKTFAEAEHFARWHAARRGIRVAVDRVETTPKKRIDTPMMNVMRDALDRLWTDLSWEAGELV